VWSHKVGACESGVVAIGATLAATHAAVPGTCDRPRIASEPGRAIAVFDDASSLWAMTMTATGAASPVMLAAGTRARLARDPAFGYWLAWDAGGALAVAKVTPGVPLVQVPITGLPAGALDAYELATINGNAYLFAVVNRKLWWTKLTM